MDAAFELLKDGHGLLRELPGVRVWGVDDGALVCMALMPEARSWRWRWPIGWA